MSVQTLVLVESCAAVALLVLAIGTDRIALRRREAAQGRAMDILVEAVGGEDRVAVVSHDATVAPDDVATTAATLGYRETDRRPTPAVVRGVVVHLERIDAPPLHDVGAQSTDAPVVLRPPVDRWSLRIAGAIAALALLAPLFVEWS